MTYVLNTEVKKRGVGLTALIEYLINRYVSYHNTLQQKKTFYDTLLK